MSFRPTRPLTRVALLLGAGLSFITGLQLFILTDHTETLFAWTIEAPLSAVTIGAAYWAAAVIAVVSWRRQPWVRARVAIPAVVVFLWLTLLVTVLHLDKFHLSAGTMTARGAAWTWLIVYILDPILLSLALFLQWRTPGEDPPREHPIPAISRTLMLVTGVLLAVVGVLMVFLPALAITIATWVLTPLTSRTIGAWVLSWGLALISMWWENDLDRIKPAVAGTATLTALLAIGFFRYRTEFFSGTVGAVSIGLSAAVAIISIIALLRSPAKAQAGM